MKAKEYLMQIKRLDSIISNKQEEVARLEELVTSTNALSTGDRVQSSGTQDKLGDTVSKICDLKRELALDIARLIEVRGEIIKVIDQVEDADLIDLLYKKYYQFKTWEKIACDMNYTYRWVTKLHGKALAEVQRILDKQELCKSCKYWDGKCMNYHAEHCEDGMLHEPRGYKFLEKE